MRSNPKRLLRMIGAIVMIVGIAASIVIYFNAGGDSGSADDSTMENGGIIQMTPQSSKKYSHDLELFGGKEAVFADEFDRWFDGLWSGQSLAFTVAFLSLVLGAVLMLAAHLLHGGVISGDTERRDHGADTHDTPNGDER